jgi:[acyl-carrier-protein] S-malonyltransferase
VKKFAFVFPGQGSQSVGMLNAFADWSVVREIVQEASEILSQDLRKMMAEGPDEALNLTTNTQPIMLTAAYAMYRLWCEQGGRKPDLVAGHSLGEYTALVAAKSIAFQDALPLVRFRAQVMQEAVPVGVGGVAAILGLDTSAVQALCATITGAQDIGVVEAVNFNSPAQTVIAGHKAAVERACEQAKLQGAKRALLLPLSAPFHSSLLQGAAQKLAAYLVDVPVHAPAIALVNNIDVAMESSPDSIRNALSRQAAGPVRWIESVQAMAAAGIEAVIESGPGSVLTGLIKRIDPALQACALSDANALEAALKLYS